MKRFIFIVALFAALFETNAQQFKDYWTDYHWTNGSEMLSSVRLNATQVVLVGNGYMDAGYGYLFEVKSLGGTNYEMRGIPESAVKERPQDLGEMVAYMLDNGNCNGDDGELWQRREVNGHDVLIKYFDDNTISTVYLPTGREMGEVVDDDLQEIIAGTYVSTTGKKFQFNIDGTCVFDGKKNTYYMSDEGEGGTPALYITLNRQYWELVPTVDGMNIYKTVPNPDIDGLSRGKLYATLKVANDTPRWAFLSDRICTQYAFAQLDKDVLRLMRNEVYARHGYRFSDARLQAHFGACKWYKPVDDNQMVTLNGVENLNEALIKDAER